MILAIDVGNSNLALGCIRDGNIESIFRLATDKHKTSHQYGLEIKNMLQMLDVSPGQISGSIISSVVPSLTDSISEAIQVSLGIVPLVVGPGIKTGLNIRMDNPAQVGADLVAEAVGCIHKYPLPLIIVDLGTATTIAVINSRGEYIGGSISPGLSLSLSALSTGTAQLPDISLERPRRVVGTNTVDSMRSGLIYGMASMLDGMAERIEDELGQSASMVMTGGQANLVAPACKKPVTVDNNLVLEGLYLIYQKNIGEKK